MEKLKHIAPKLSGIKKENPFSTPDNYFEDFSAKLHSKIESSKIIEHKKPNALIRILKPTLGLAASFAIIFMLVYWPLSKFDERYSMNDQEETEMMDENYYSLIAELDENSLYTLLDEEQEDNTFSEDELVSYLSATMNEYEFYVESK